MKKLLLTIIIILFNIFITINNSQLYATDCFTVKEIAFEGLQRIQINELISNIPFRINDKITEKDIAHTIKVLFSTGYFENIQILKKQKNSIIIRVKEYPLISHITFHGNQTIKKNILEEHLKLEGIEKGKLFNQKNIFKIEEILKHFYCDIGKYSTTIKTIITNLPNNQVNIKIVFKEGKSTNIKKINIFGNKNFSTTKLLNLFQLHDKIPVFNIFFHNKYQKKILLNDLKSLHDFYANQGFAKFNIDSTQIYLTPNKKDIYLTIYITEGLQYHISDIFINGNISNFSEKINTFLTIYPNKLYSYQEVQNFINSTKKFLGNHGYIHPKIITEIETNDIRKTLKLYINIDIGKRFYINKIKFIGNIITQDSVLRREIRQMEKTWINNKLIYQGQERLNRIGYFEYTKINTEYLPLFSDQVNIIYEVKEHSSGSMNMNLGIGTESGINFQCGIQQDNLFGTGNTFSLNANKNQYQNYIELSAIQPYFIINNIGLGEKISYNNFSTNNTDLSNYGLNSYGASLNIRFPISEYNMLHFNLDYIHNNLNNIKPQIAIWRYLYSQGIDPKIIINTNTSNNKKTSSNIHFNSNDLFLITSWRHNSLNHAYFPTCGTYSDLSGKITIPGSNNKYYKITINNIHYIPLHKKNSPYWILMTHIYTGYSNGLYGKKENPFYDNFYSGGINIIRGFRPNTIGPKAAYYKCTYNNQTYNTCAIENSKDAIGGNAITILNGELIIPSPFLSKKYTNIIRTSIFVDLGTIWDTHWHNTLETQIANIPNYKNPTNIRISNGLAVQWISPIGPIIFSYSKIIKKYTGDKLEQFQFNIGKTW